MPATRGTKTTDSMQEILRAVLQDLAVAKVAPDADLDVLGAVEKMVVEALRAPQQAAIAKAMSGIQAATGGAPMGPMGGQGGPAGLPTFSAPPGGGVPGLRNGGTLPPVDELRRMIGGVQGG